MSLNYIGLHRQFSSPNSTLSLESPRTPDDDVTQDNKDVLIERLNDLVLRLSKDSPVENSTISAIHSGVDRIELLLETEAKGMHKRTSSLESTPDSPKTGEDILRKPLTPTRNTRMRFPESPRSPHQQISKERVSVGRAAEIAKSAESLASKLSETVNELQARKEESDKIHDLLITRVELAAERILVLEYRVKEMEEDFDANQSELKFLRIQLQAIQAQCSQYQDVDPDLSQSIMNWKVDWEGIDKRSKARRKKCHSYDSVDTGAVDETLDVVPG